MTKEDREKAIQVFEDMKRGIYPWYPETYFDMAIEALSKQETVTEFADRCRECGSMLGRQMDKMCFDGMTNEDALNAMLRKIFPKMVFIHSINETNKTQAIYFSEQWLNAEYKVERGEVYNDKNSM